MKKEDESKNDNNKVVELSAADIVPVIERSTIKRMLATLDRFLTKRFLSIIAFCTAIISVCTVWLAFAKTSFATSSGAKNGFGDNLTLETWLWSIIAVFGFIAILTGIYALARQKKTIK